MEPIIHELQEIVGEENASDLMEDRVSYSRDMVSPLSGEFIPDYVVLPGSVREVQEVIRLANKHKLPVYPYTYGTNAAGYTLPVKGGIILGLKKMNRIIEINEDAMAAIIEPGVTWRQLTLEARKLNLQPTLPLGPYTGSPIGSFALWNITGHATRFGADRVISLEVVLPNGELLRTASSALPSHEKLNPYFRYAYGPDLTGLFRGSFGVYGIITKAVYQLYPLSENEIHLEAGFDDLPSLLNAMKEIERLDISKFCVFYDQNFLVNTCAPSIRQLEDILEIKKLRDIFPQWVLSIGLSGLKELASLHQEIFLERVTKSGGKIFDLTSYPALKKRINDMIPGASLVISRMYEPHGSAASVVAVAPSSNIRKLWELANRLVEEFDIRDPLSGDLLDPPSTGYPYDRVRNIYFEREFSFDPTKKDDVVKIKEARKAWVRRMIPLGGSLMMLNAVYAEQLLPSYSNILKRFKRALDPNDILSPKKLVM